MKKRELNRNEKHFKILGVEFAYLCVMGIIFAFFGWVAENVVRVISLGIIDSRFHFLPFTTPYALIPFAFHILLGSPDNLTFFGKPIFKNKPDKKSKMLSDVIICLFICAVVFVSELAVGNLWDKVFGVKLWNYGNLPCHVTQYAGLIPSLGYGFGAFLLFKFFYAPVLKLIREKNAFKGSYNYIGYSRRRNSCRRLVFNRANSILRTSQHLVVGFYLVKKSVFL